MNKTKIIIIIALLLGISTACSKDNGEYKEISAKEAKKMIEEDVVDAVIGLGKNLFYNSSMESCLLVCNMNKPKERKGKIIFIDGKDEIRLERSAAYLKAEHIKRMADAYWNFKDEDGFTKVITSKKIVDENDGNLSIQLYVKSNGNESTQTVEQLLAKTKSNQDSIQQGFDDLMTKLNELGIEAL